MAFSTRSSLFFFTTLVLLSTQIHARDSFFFGKFHRESPKDQNPSNVLPLKTSQKTTLDEESIPNKKDQEQDPSFVPQSENGYGLYGHETTYENQKEEFNNNNNNNKYDDKVNGETFSTPSLSEKEESYDENVKEETYSENNEEDKRDLYNSNAYGTELERETPYKGYNHNMERQGMSDTRFMAKGNYYYDLYNDKNHGHFYRKPHRKSPAGYYYSPETENNNYEQSSYSHGNNNDENNFKDPYNSKWEKNMMNEQPEEFVEEQGEQFKP